MGGGAKMGRGRGRFWLSADVGLMVVFVMRVSARVCHDIHAMYGCLGHNILAEPKAKLRTF